MTVHEDAHLKRTLTLPTAVLFGLSYMLPLTVFTTFGIVNVMTEGHIVSGLVAPAIGVTMCVWLWLSLSYDALLIGLAWVAAGVAQLGFVTGGFSRHPPELAVE